MRAPSSSSQLRRSFLKFFKEKKHKVVPSSPLVPKDDPTLLFTSAGMVQFKKFYSGTVPLPFRRACSCQKCLRASDLDEVGKSPKHNTFFEMLGNFSFGDYFKTEAIDWAWEYLTKVLHLREEKLWVSVFREDEEAYSIWRDGIGISSEKIIKLGEEDNFWGPAGGTGACGPCSEIYYDLGEEKGCGNPNCAPGCDCGRWIEVWNLVFPEYDQQPDGSRVPLKNRGIDTGLGLERLAMVVQGVDSVFKTDLFRPLITELEKDFFKESDYASAGSFEQTEEITRAMNIIVDHVRALTFTISEGVIPSNEGRGYVLRRLLRRALRQRHLISRELKESGQIEPFLYRLVGVVSNIMGDEYPELLERREEVALIVKAEEERFLNTLERGIAIFTEIAKDLERRKENKLPGEEIFRLYDTYGFPLDMTRELAREVGLNLDLEGFERAMELQKKRAQEKSYFVNANLAKDWKVYKESKSSEFLGYETTEADSRILRWREMDGKIEVILERTPFYPEAGGQVGDKGYIIAPSFKIRVEDTRKFFGDPFSAGPQDSSKFFEIVHIGVLKEGSLADEPVRAVVDIERRRAIERAHTATHLLHYALREILGRDTRQEGSLVEEDRLRFDFNCYRPLSTQELHSIEELINQKILERHPVEVFKTTYEEAKKKGAIALFGEKYGEEVRVVKIGDFSMELCGGTHLGNSSEVGLLKLIREEPVAAGIRRLEALTGREAYKFTSEEESVLKTLSSILKTPVQKLEEKVSRVLEEKKRLEMDIQELQSFAVQTLTEKLLRSRQEFNGFTLIVSEVELKSIEHLRVLADRLRKSIGKRLLGVLASRIEGRAKFLAFVSDDLKESHPASSIAKEIARMIGGGGGGKPTIAEAGGKDPATIEPTLDKISLWIRTEVGHQ